MKSLWTSLRLLLALTFLTGLLYPLLVWGVGNLLFPRQAGGSLITRDGQVVGSRLLAQNISSPAYFHPRPSAAEFTTVPSGASNLSWTNQKLVDAVTTRRGNLPTGESHPALLTTSGSGLDPDLPVGAVDQQVERIASARDWTPRQRAALQSQIAKLSRSDFAGQRVVNVNDLNFWLAASSAHDTGKHPTRP